MGTHELLTVGILLATGVLTAVLAAFGWRHRIDAGADWFAATMAANTVWIVIDLFGVLFESRFAVLFADYASTTMATIVPALWFCFVLAYTGREHLLDRRGLGVVWAIPAVVITAILTSSFHDLYYSELDVVRQAGGLAVVSPPGPLAWVNLAYFAVLVVVGLWLLGRMLVGHDRLYSRQAVWLLVGTLAPAGLLGVLLALGESQQFPALSLGFSMLGLAYAHSLFTHRLFDLSLASRRIGMDEAFDSLDEGVVVATADRDVVAVNDRACRLFDCRRDAVLARPLAAIADALSEVDEQVESVEVNTNGRVLAVSVSSVYDTRDRLTGYALVARDVTEKRRREQRLAVLDRVFRHNIRNTMNAVVGPTAVLADRLEGEDAETAAIALSAGESVLALSEKVRDVEAIMTRSVEPTAVPLDEFLNDAVQSIRDEVPVTVETDVPSDCRVRTDSTVLSVVVENVLENAAVHSSADDPSRTRGDSFERDATAADSPAGEPGAERGGHRGPDVRVAVEDRDGGCLVHVSDDGPGIPRAELDVLRSGVETALEHASGVGLWAIHWGMSRLSGAVQFEPSDRGTRVTLWVPDIDDGTAEPPPPDVTDDTGSEWFGRTPDDRPATDGRSPGGSPAVDSPPDGSPADSTST
ncbi:MAG: histidine kinase N-terminal 7TM domain-containing protein [Haloarculaceae archaeon]